jgi:uncharacterized protein (DUF58 family)
VIERLAYRWYWRRQLFRAWIRRHCTRAGLGVISGLLIAAILGADTEQTLAYKAFALLFSLMLVGLVLSWGFRGRFAARRLLPRFATAGQPLTYRIILRNLTRKRQAGLALLEDLGAMLPTFDEFNAAKHPALARKGGSRRAVLPPAVLKEIALPVLGPNQALEVQTELTPLKRGILRFKGVTLARTDPLGLFRSLADWEAPDSLVVLPRRYHLPAIALPGSRKYQQGGIALASAVGESEEFISLRDYRLGDPLRHMHWRSWAKVGKPIIKEFQDEFFVRHALILDTFADNPYDELFEEAVSVAASFACVIQTQESLLDLMFVGPRSYCFTAGRGLAYTDQMLEILASVTVCRTQPFAALEKLVLDHVNLVSGCVCVLIAWDEPRKKLLERLLALGVPLLVLLPSPPGTASLDPGPLRAQPECFHVLPADAIAERLLKLHA